MYIIIMQLSARLSAVCVICMFSGDRLCSFQLMFLIMFDVNKTQINHVFVITMSSNYFRLHPIIESLSKAVSEIVFVKYWR